MTMGRYTTQKTVEAIAQMAVGICREQRVKRQKFVAITVDEIDRYATWTLDHNGLAITGMFAHNTFVAARTIVGVV